MAVALIFCILAINTELQIVRDTWSSVALYGCAQLDKTCHIHSAYKTDTKIKEKRLETIPHIYSFIL